jgi:hypothetical protein
VTTIKRTQAVLPLPRYYNKKSIIRQSCYLCGVKKDLTAEHVFARILFRPNDLEQPIKLSACTTCNTNKERDEDYFYTHAVVTTETPEAELARQIYYKKLKKLRPTILVKGKNIAGMGLFNQIRDNMKDIDVYSSGGIYLGSGGQIPINSKRYTNFYVNIAKGLITSASGKIIDWQTFEIKSQFDSYMFKTVINEDVYLLPFKKTSFLEEWGKYLVFAGMQHVMASGKAASVWSIAIYNDQMATISFLEK